MIKKNLSYFLVDEGREDSNTKIRRSSLARPSAKRHLNDVSLALAWKLCNISGDLDQYWFKTPYFVIFRGESGSLPPSLDPRNHGGRPSRGCSPLA